MAAVSPARPPDAARLARLSIFFDGGCPLCRREIALMRRLDRARAIAFVDVADPAGAAVCPVDRAEALARLHAVEIDDQGARRTLSGAAAFAAMWRAIPLLRPLGLLARRPTVLNLLERWYLRFLAVRPRLQRWLA